MKAAILYGCRRQISPLHRPVHLPGGGEYFVRADVVDWREDIGALLEQAKPVAGETVLNTVWVDHDT
jgi:hypothetical protein